MTNKREKWAVLCGTGMDENYLTAAKIFEATEAEIFEVSPSGNDGGILDEFCNMQASFPIKMTNRSKFILKDVIKEFEKIK